MRFTTMLVVALPISAVHGQPPPSVFSAPPSNWTKKLTVDSFGYTSAMQLPGFVFSPGYTASLFDLHGLECPGCILGPRNTTRVTPPPFGANLTLHLRNDHVQLFTGFGGISAVKAPGIFDPQGFRKFSTADGDNWLIQTQFGARVAVDRSRHIWVGATGRYLYNFGPGPRQGMSLTGDTTFRLGR
jgi:hypothetical protein